MPTPYFCRRRSGKPPAGQSSQRPRPSRFGRSPALSGCAVFSSVPRLRMAFKKASFMTDPSMSPEMPGAAETARFLRRFADLMSIGYNATYLQRAADLLETLTARVLAASDEDALWRYKYESLTHHANALGAECEALKQDIEGQLNVSSSI